MFYEEKIAESYQIGLISCPHPGLFIPEEFKELLTSQTEAQMEDVDLDSHQLVDGDWLSKMGVHQIWQKVHRICVDLNRSPDKAVLNWKTNSKGIPLVIKTPDSEFKEKALKIYFTPYFKKLEKLSQPHSLVIDLHSMPSRPTEYHLSINPHQSSERPDFCLSDLDGKAPVKNEIEYLKKELTQRGYDTRLNEPYKGGYITQRLNGLGRRIIQIETNRRLYMNELSKQIIPEKMQRLQKDLSQVLESYFNNFSRSA